MTEINHKGVFKTAKVEVVDKKMKVFLALKSVQAEGAVPLSLEYLKDILNTSGVRYGIMFNVLEEIVEGKINDDRVLVAQGEYPQPGSDASIELYFSNNKSLKPQEHADGHIDYKEVNMVESVEKDAPIAKKNIATVGSPGTDVFGNVSPGVFGKDFPFTPGQGTYRDSNENTLIRASIDGIIFYDEKTHHLEVQKLFVVPESVDYSTGNLHVKSSVEIKQNIKSGFSVETPYNIDVKGGIEHAVVICGGVLKVKEGINGDGKTVITVGKELHSGYISNQVVRCNGSVYASFEIRNSIIECDNEVTLVRNNGVIIGGKITATNKITAPVVGNDYNITTELEVGVVLKHKEKYLKKLVEETEVQRQIEELKKQISYIAHKPDNNAKKMQLMNYKEIWAKCTASTIKIKNELKEIEAAYYNVSNPIVIIRNKVYPGTVIKIKDKVFEVKEILSKVTFKIENEKITYSHIK
ncbi:MAG: hypothetical protein FD143_1363 [Ignavibacteria bacterium]|nr:MAG: hypothetical protein FD143_1363 [Ignavibacteria bacterium]KAF0161750.1 MAG: hypothetical protein FD188_555 [Ignavibacteria bacterium]